MALVPACQITANYYAGFAYFMIRKYATTIQLYVIKLSNFTCWLFFSNDAVNGCLFDRYQHILGYMQRTKQFFQNRSFQAEDINKKNDQMLALLAISSTFCPLRLDESVNIQIKEKQGDKVARLLHGDMTVYDDLFFSGCPKFLSPVVSENPTSPFGSRLVFDLGTFWSCFKPDLFQWAPGAPAPSIQGRSWATATYPNSTQFPETLYFYPHF